jgi:beta-lactamase regulating signal transducer with metallopeptidase domain
MPAVFIYLLKLSVSLGVVFLFYQLVLRRLTFYNWNRCYLLVYSLLSFLIPFINISPALQENELNNSTMVQWVPVLYNQSTDNPSLSIWNVLSFIVVAGMLLMLIRLLIQLFSFRRMMRKAKLISGDDINLYQVNESIIPFSFGNAVFINRHLHTEKELEEIIRHEFVHVKQRHSIDIIWCEILCLLNWYNPFVWLIRKSIRQNLEFVADNKVLENGLNKKQYQYLLLKVIGDNQFSIAQKFNFSSLKKRIAMMNKNKSAKMHLLRFLFLLPVLAVILVSFRKEIGDTLTGKQKQLKSLPPSVLDTIPEVTKPNSKGYIINVKDQKGECLLVIKDKKGKEVKRLLLHLPLQQLCPNLLRGLIIMLIG